MIKRKPFKKGELLTVQSTFPPLVQGGKVVVIEAEQGEWVRVRQYMPNNSGILSANPSLLKRDREPFERGDEIVCHSAMRFKLSKGKTYKVIGDEMEGIFQSDPYVEVIDDLNQRLVCHAHRFHYPEDAP